MFFRRAQPTLADIAVGGGNLLGRWTRTFSENSDLRLQAYFDRTHRRIPGSFTANIDIHDFDFQHRFPIAGAHEYEKLIPNAHLEIFEETGHVPMLERPARFNELVQGFIDG